MSVHAAVQTHNYAKTALTKTMTIKETVGSDVNYADESKLTDFITCDYVQAGW